MTLMKRERKSMLKSDRERGIPKAYSSSMRNFDTSKDSEQPVANSVTGSILCSNRWPSVGESPHTLCPRSLSAFCNQLAVASATRQSQYEYHVWVWS